MPLILRRRYCAVSICAVDTGPLGVVQVTYSSDYFQQLYDLAVELIKRGHAYVDHQVGRPVQEQKGDALCH